jgi:hypothetical protein
MGGTAQDTMVLFASLVVAVLVAQTVLLLVFVIAFRSWCNRTGAMVEQVSRNVEPVLRASRELLEEGREKIASVTANLNEISQIAKDQMVRLDGLVKDTTERAHMQVVRLDHLVGDTMNRVEETTEAIQQGVLGPVREAAAVVAGVRTTLDFLFNRHRKTVERATHDEELFI